MGKIEAVVELYKTVFPDVKVEKKGTWIRVYDEQHIKGYRSTYADEIISEIFNKTGNVYRWDGEYKTLDMVAAHKDTLWDTGDSWSTQYDEWNTAPEPEPEEENLFEDIGEI
jgi:hypothetical protein